MLIAYRLCAGGLATQERFTDDKNMLIETVFCRPPRAKMRKFGSWAKTIESTKTALLRRLGRPKIVLQLFLVVCVSYFLFVSSSRQAIDNNEINDSIGNNSSSLENQDEMLMDESLVVKSEPKRILYWTGYYDQKDMIFGFGQEPFIQAGCKVTNCLATDDRSLLDQSDAIIFHARQYNLSDLPTRRLPHQRYIFYLFETLPMGRNLHYFSKAVDDIFNWTMTHRRDSDIYCAEPYGAIRRKESSPWLKQLPPYLAPGERPVAPAKLMKGLRNHPRLAKKDKLLAWFCSNQRTHGHREEYVAELGKHIPVDIYGKCGNKTCLPKNSPRCNTNLLDEYKFYLSAENSLCADYVSEKFYRALQTDIIPVVYGGADYAAYAPPNSYIHVADFASPKELAEYLLLLDKNEALYLKYFEWKKDYEIVKRPLDGWCDLCEKLNDPTLPRKSYENMAKWWFEDVPCYPGLLFLQRVLNWTNVSL